MAVVRFLDPIKPKDIGVVWLNNLLVTSPPTSSILTMSLVNNRVFERSMGHRISCEDARFHMHTSDGQHYPLNQQVRSCTDLGLTNLTRILVVGGPRTDA